MVEQVLQIVIFVFAALIFVLFILLSVMQVVICVSTRPEKPKKAGEKKQTKDMETQTGEGNSDKTAVNMISEMGGSDKAEASTMPAPTNEDAAKGTDTTIFDTANNSQQPTVKGGDTTNTGKGSVVSGGNDDPVATIKSSCLSAKTMPPSIKEPPPVAVPKGMARPNQMSPENTGKSGRSQSGIDKTFKTPKTSQREVNSVYA